MSGVSKQEARRAARAAAAAGAEELARRTKANVESLTAFLQAQGRLEQVDEWFKERTAALKTAAGERRSRERQACGEALAQMRERGESVREIARLAGIGEKLVRDLIRDSQQNQDTPAAAATPAEEDREVDMNGGAAEVEAKSTPGSAGVEVA